MSPKQLRHLDYVQHMLEATVQARSYVEGMSKEQFIADPKTQDAVILKLLFLGEAATKVMTDAPDFVALHPEVPWKEMRGMRNRMAHGYFDINLDIVWGTVSTSLPDLEPKLRQVLSTTSGDSKP